MEERSEGMVRLVYFLHCYRRCGPTGRYVPPEEFDDLNLREVYEQFFQHLGGARTFATFRGSAEGLRKGNVREHIEDGTPYLPMYEPMLNTWQHLSRTEQWEYLQQFRVV